MVDGFSIEEHETMETGRLRDESDEEDEDKKKNKSKHKSCESWNYSGPVCCSTE